MSKPLPDSTVKPRLRESETGRLPRGLWVEPAGIEAATSCLQSGRTRYKLLRPIADPPACRASSAAAERSCRHLLRSAASILHPRLSTCATRKR